MAYRGLGEFLASCSGGLPHNPQRHQSRTLDPRDDIKHWETLTVHADCPNFRAAVREHGPVPLGNPFVNGHGKQKTLASSRAESSLRESSKKRR
jgi:hypothetical protein